jgi:ribose transport system permease protein
MSLKERLQDRVISLSISILILGLLLTLIYPNQFPTLENLSQLLLNLSIDTIVAVGMMILLISGMFDLSVGSVVAFAGGLTGYLMYYHDLHFLLAIAAGLAGAVFIGLINGWLIAKAGINPMIQTLAMMGIVRGMALMLSGAGIQNFPYNFIYIGQSKLLSVQAPVWYMLLIVLLFSFLVKRTVFFRRYYFIGSNERAARISGIQVEKMKIWAFVISATLAGIAGVLLASRLGAALSTSGRGLELRVITAVILGGASLSGGTGKIWGAFLGALFMAVINNLLIIARVSGYWQEIILGLILIAAVGIDQWLLRKMNK